MLLCAWSYILTQKLLPRELVNAFLQLMFVCSPHRATQSHYAGMYSHIKSLVRVGAGDIHTGTSMEKEGASRGASTASAGSGYRTASPPFTCLPQRAALQHTGHSRLPPLPITLCSLLQALARRLALMFATPQL